MRKMIIAVAVSATLIQTSGAQNKSETIEGNGKIVTRDIPVQSFSKLKASGVYELKLSQGNKESVKIEADENLQELFQVKNEGNKLVIDTKKMKNTNLKSKSKMRVYITFKNLTDLELSTVGNVKSEGSLAFEDLALDTKSVGNIDLQLTANKLNVTNAGVGDVTLSGKAQNTVMKNSGVGSVHAGEFVVQTMNIDNSGVGSAEVNAAKELKVKDSFLGKVKNKGNATMKKTKKVVI